MAADPSIAPGPVTGRPLVIDVAGKPITQGSKKVGKFGGIYESASGELDAWRALVAAVTRSAVLARAQRTGGWEVPAYPKGTPLKVTLVFLFPRPASHYSRGANATLRPGAAAHPATRPDIDKLTRAVLDALKTGAAYHDDGQVTDLDVRKRYATGATLPRGGAHIEIEAI